MLLSIVVIGMMLKSVLVLAANRQVGYTVARVATDLRLDFIRSLLGARWEYYLRQPVGALANSLATEATRGAESYLYGATVIALCIQATVYSIVALLVSWQATARRARRRRGVHLPPQPPGARVPPRGREADEAPALAARAALPTTCSRSSR